MTCIAQALSGFFRREGADGPLVSEETMSGSERGHLPAF